MGLGPAQVDAMSFWQFFACAEGYRRAHATEEESPEPSDDLVRRVTGEI